MSGSESEDKKSDGKKADTAKWWEVYAVRYFVGTIIGGIVVFILSGQSESSLKDVFTFKLGTELNAQVVSVLAALGLAICYISSAPILVLHATRGAYMKRDARHFNVALFSMLAFAIVGSGVVSCLAKLSSFQYFSVSLLWLVLTIQAVPLVFAILHRGEDAHSYYRRLAAARADVRPAAQQYIESYRHLREHGNAFFIVMFESLFGLIIWLYPTPWVVLTTAFVWVVPAALVWIVATCLEYRFAIDFEDASQGSSGSSGTPP